MLKQIQHHHIRRNLVENPEEVLIVEHRPGGMTPL